MGLFQSTEESAVDAENPSAKPEEIKQRQGPYVLVTGGTGFIGSHTCVALIQNDFIPIVVDNLVNSSEESLARVQKITGKEVEFFNVDLATDKEGLMDVCRRFTFQSCIHFAGLKAVGESVEKPLLYYRNNLDSTMNLIECLDACDCKSIIFSSSATVYGNPEEIPILESTSVGKGITNPYGKTKFFIEEILADYAKSRSDWRVVLLRYFNPIGAHESGLIGEDPQGRPNNLMPYLAQVAVGRRKHLTVFGNDYDTPDGTGVRDYIHVVDLADGHLAALKNDILNKEKSGTSVYNLGTGRGTSVMELLRALEKASGKEIPFVMGERRAGDVATVYADCSYAEKELGWKAKLSIERACEDTWRWQSQNPTGFN